MVNDVEGVNTNSTAEKFKKAVLEYSKDEETHIYKTDLLLSHGKMSMEFWYSLYENGDEDLKRIIEESNFNPCRNTKKFILHDGYRINLIYNINDPGAKAITMVESYKKLGFDESRILTLQEVITLDPFLANFCEVHRGIDGNFKESAVAVWRPGGCIDTQLFIPKFYEYLRQKMGTYINEDGKEKYCFQVRLNREVIGVELEENNIVGLYFTDRIKRNKHTYRHSEYVFCPGESVGTLSKFGFKEPDYAKFAGASLKLYIEIPEKKMNILS